MLMNTRQRLFAIFSFVFLIFIFLISLSSPARAIKLEFSEPVDLPEILIQTEVESDLSLKRQVFLPADNSELLIYARENLFSDSVTVNSEETINPAGVKQIRLEAEMDNPDSMINGVYYFQDLLTTHRFIMMDTLLPLPVSTRIYYRIRFNGSNLVKFMANEQVTDFAGREIIYDIHDGQLQIPVDGLDFEFVLQQDNHFTKTIMLLVLGLAFLSPVIFKTRRRQLLPVSAVAFSLFMAGLLINIMGESPIAAMGAMFLGAFGSLDGFFYTLANSTPLLLTGLSVAICFQAGLFNIGGEGQMYIGAIASTATAIFLTGVIPAPLLLVLSLLAAIISAGFYGSIAGILKARWQVHEVISTIMLNYIAYSLTAWLVSSTYLLKAPGPSPQTARISTGLFKVMVGNDLNAGFLLALAMPFLIWWLLTRTVIGFQIRAVGSNIYAAVTAGINSTRVIAITMFIGGGLAGIAGFERAFGVFRRFSVDRYTGYGFDGIAVALLARNHPLAAIITAILFGALKSGGALMGREASVPPEIVVVVQAIIIFFVASEALVEYLLKPFNKSGQKEKQL